MTKKTKNILIVFLVVALVIGTTVGTFAWISNAEGTTENKNQIVTANEIVVININFNKTTGDLIPPTLIKDALVNSDNLDDLLKPEMWENPPTEQVVNFYLLLQGGSPCFVEIVNTAFECVINGKTVVLEDRMFDLNFSATDVFSVPNKQKYLLFPNNETNANGEELQAKVKLVMPDEVLNPVLKNVEYRLKVEVRAIPIVAETITKSAEINEDSISGDFNLTGQNIMPPIDTDMYIAQVGIENIESLEDGLSNNTVTKLSINDELANIWTIPLPTVGNDFIMYFVVNNTIVSRSFTKIVKPIITPPEVTV